jgi:hypothetical protein
MRKTADGLVANMFDILVWYYSVIGALIAAFIVLVYKA